MKRKIKPIDRDGVRKQARFLSSTIGKRGAWPLNAPGMPAPGPNFLRVATLLGDSTEYKKGTKTTADVFVPGPKLTKLYARALREPGFTLDVDNGHGRYETVTFVPGHIWGQNVDSWRASMQDPNIDPIPVDGPHPAEVMVIGKMPWKNEIVECRNMVGETGEILTELIAQMRVKGANKWYITNLNKFAPPGGGRDLKSAWIADCKPILQAELRIVRPKYILCLGAEASKQILGPKFTVSHMAGRVVKHTFDVRLSPDDDTPPHTCYVMTVLHPAAVAADPAQYRILESNFGRFSNLIATGNVEVEESGLDHRKCDNLEEALEWVEEATHELAMQSPKERMAAWDLEWQGQHPVNKGSYVRTIQCSWGHKKAICFVLRNPGGGIAFRDRDGRPAIKRLVKALNKFARFARPVGHFLVSDLEWAESLGLKLTEGWEVPLYDRGKKLAWERFRAGKGWLDTAMMNHAIEETAPLGLETLTMRYTMAPRYDLPLDEWKKKHCKEQGIKAEALEGYGDCPDDVLVPYANYDADVTRRIAVTLLPMLDVDYDGNCCWEPFWESMIIQKPILRIHQHGIRVDRARIDDLTKKFITWRAKKEDEIRTWACWHETEIEEVEYPAFNIRSVQHAREFLFGEQLNGKKTKSGETIRIRPPGAKSLYLQPLLDTSKPPRRWIDLVERKLEHSATPGTGKMILGIMAQEELSARGDDGCAEQINMIRDYRFLDQVLKSVLRPPKTDEHDNWIENDYGELEYSAGLAYSIDDDGRVRTHLYPTAETGRWKSSRPNLQNISKSRDPDYVRLLGGQKDPSGRWSGGDYTHSLRSVLRASDGYALLEFDYKGAELYGMALMSGSKKMQDHCLRSLLKDKGFDKDGNKADGGKFPDPNYYDIHSNVAVLAFQLNCRPTKDALDAIGKAHFRTLAKNVIFGIAYGRGAKAIALQAKEQGISVTPDDAQMVIDAIFEMYPELVPFFEEAKTRALREKWLCHSHGRFRRFPSARDFKLEGEFERQAMNFPIQGMIASCVDRGLAYLVDAIERRGLGNDIRLLLQIHDAGLVEVRYDLVPYAIKLIEWAMVEMVEIWPTDLAGIPRGDGPYRLGLEFEVSKHWGEKFAYDEAVRVGLDPKYAKAPPKPTEFATKA